MSINGSLGRMTHFSLSVVTYSIRIGGGCPRQQCSVWARTCVRSGNAFGLASAPARATLVCRRIGIGGGKLPRKEGAHFEKLGGGPEGGGGGGVAHGYCGLP